MPGDMVLPPAPPGVRYVRVWLLGIVISDDALRMKVDHYFHWPMIILAIAILPLLIIEFTILSKPAEDEGAAQTAGSIKSPLTKAIQYPAFKPQTTIDYTVYQQITSKTGQDNTDKQITALDKQHFLVQWAVWIAGAVIWLAFLLEYLIKVMLAESRIEYTKLNWLDIVIIVLPFLRVFRVARLARTSRVFRLRGVGMKVAKYIFSILIGMDATDRLLHKVGITALTVRKETSAMTRHELITEVKKSRRLCDAWDKWHDVHDKYVQEHKGACYIAVKPQVDNNDSEMPVNITAEPTDVDSGSGNIGR